MGPEVSGSPVEPEAFDIHKEPVVFLDPEGLMVSGSPGDPEASLGPMEQMVSDILEELEVFLDHKETEVHLGAVGPEVF